MCRCCLIGGMDIKNFLRIFSRHGFTVQEKAKANKAQTQKKRLLLFIYGTGVYTTNQTQGPWWHRGPCTAWQPTWHPAEVQLQPRALPGTAQCKLYLLTYSDAFSTSAHVDLEQRTQGANTR